MESIIFYNTYDINTHLNKRDGEIKLGESIGLVSSLDDLENTSAEFVLVGIPEDIGVQANHGKPGTSGAWSAFLSAYLNIQSNRFNDAQNCILLGEIDCREEVSAARPLLLQENIPYERLGSLVEQIDQKVSAVIKAICATGKIPIVIGGGHNNAYGNIKGAAEAYDHPINVVNVDAHTDLRRTDYRHSGNGFSFAREHGYLDKYSIIGLHKNYTPQYIFDAMDADKKTQYTLFEEYLHLTPLDKLVKLKKGYDFTNENFGFEIDCDAIQNFHSSAMGPTGFSVNDIRSFLKLARKENVLYLHLCEATPDSNGLVGKTLSYFVSDFTRALD